MTRPVAHALPVSADSVIITGRGDDPAWARASPVEWNSDYTGQPTGIVTRARFLYSPRALYVLWELEGTRLNVDRSWSIESPRPKLYEEDCVEIFFTPDPACPWRYYEMEQGPYGHFWDLDIDRRASTSDATWTSGSRIATARDPAARTATIESVFTAPDIVRALTPGARLPIGLYRMEGRDPRFYLAWSPPRTPKPNFHVPDAFGLLALDPAAPTSLFGATLR
ncbi:MAG TPA: carbohydrate-binding family 9-like protein [Acidimicrobiales bacterium]|nr:carbohydrate-binding family 9-like protein [Acidimicrobiales bacterium]